MKLVQIVQTFRDNFEAKTARMSVLRLGPALLATCAAPALAQVGQAQAGGAAMTQLGKALPLLAVLTVSAVIALIGLWLLMRPAGSSEPLDGATASNVISLPDRRRALVTARGPAQRPMRLSEAVAAVKAQMAQLEPNAAGSGER